MQQNKQPRFSVNMLHPECVSVVSYVISERLWGLQGVVVKKISLTGGTEM